MCCGFRAIESLINMFLFICLIAVLPFQDKVQFPRGGIRQLNCRIHRCWSKIWNSGSRDKNVSRHMFQRKKKTHCYKTFTRGIQVLPRMRLRRFSRGIPWNKQDKNPQFTSMWREADTTRIRCCATSLRIIKAWKISRKQRTCTSRTYVRRDHLTS